jgi:MOSC domain-containing protein YiiM
MVKRPNPLDRYALDIAPGKLMWIGVRPQRREPLQSLEATRAVATLGLEGRQISLISEEFILQAAQFLKQAHIDPGLLRRNLVVKGLNLNALRRQRFTIGTAVFEATQLCHPCARMEENLGKGGVVAMLGHGGLCAKIIESGDIAIGDTVSVLSPEAQ